MCLECMKGWIASVRENGRLDAPVNNSGATSITVRDVTDLIESLEECPHATTSHAPAVSAPTDADRRALGRLAFKSWGGGNDAAWIALSSEHQRRWCDSADAVRRKVIER